MQRRNFIATALFAPPLVFTGFDADSEVLDLKQLRVTVLYDAFGRNPTLQKDWGYCAFVEYGGKRILFDTGNNAGVLAHNASAMHVDLSKLDFVVMSHRHGDHMGGMGYLLHVNPKVRIYAPKETFGVYGADLPSTFYRKDDSLTSDFRYYGGTPPATMRFGSAWPDANISLIDKQTEIAPGMHLISLVSNKPGTLELRELSLAVDTPEGVVIVVACSHTGIDNIVQTAATSIRPQILCVAGGFHLVVANDAEIEAAVRTLHDTYKVAYVAPGHCTGEPTFSALGKAFGDRYLYAGLGSIFVAGNTPQVVGLDVLSNPQALNAEDLESYRTLKASSSGAQRGLFANLGRSAGNDGTYLAQWRRSLIGCC